MNSFLPIEIAASGMNAQRLRMITIASNLANIDSTRTADGPGPYRRREVVFQAQPIAAFQTAWAKQLDSAESSEVSKEILRRARAVSAYTRLDVRSDLRKVHDPGHPDADNEGYVMYPNVSTIKEMTNMMAASRSYEANLATMKATLSMIERALQIAG